MSLRAATLFSTAPTPPLCENPSDSNDSSYEAYVIRLSVHKLENKKHTNKLRNSTLIRSVHQRALQQALSSLCWEAAAQQLPDCSVTNYDVEAAPTSEFSIDLDSMETENDGRSVWDMIDAYEVSRKRAGDDVIMMDEADDAHKRLCLGVDGLPSMPEFLPSLNWESPMVISM